MEELLAFYKAHHTTTTTSITTRGVADELINHTDKAGRRSCHIKNITSHLKAVCSVFPKSLSDVTVHDIDNYLHGIPNLKTRKNHRITIVTLFRFAQRKGYLPQGLSPADMSSKPRAVAHDPEVFTTQEMTKLLVAASSNPKIKSFLVLGGFCGLRSAEIQRLDWSAIKDDHIVVGASITKTARRRIVEIPDNAREWLSDIRKERGAVSYKYNSAVYNALTPLCKKANVEWKQNAPRHSFASYHLEAFRDPQRTAKTAGHSPMILETVYAKLVSRAEALEWFTITPTK